MSAHRANKRHVAKLWTEGYSLREIATHNGVSRQRIQAILSSLGHDRTTGGTSHSPLYATARLGRAMTGFRMLYQPSTAEARSA